MKKGKFGVALPFYAVLAFVCAMFGFSTGALLILGVALFVEKDEWTTRQCMQAFFATFIVSCLGILTNILQRIRMVMNYGSAFDVFTKIIGIIDGPIRLVLELFVLALLLLGVTKVMRGQEANLPVFSTWAYKAYGYVRQVTVPVQPQYQQAPQQQPQYPAQQPQAPQQYPAQQPQAQAPVAQNFQQPQDQQPPQV
ncbi:MAG: hypothetical protein ACK5JF_10930 [Oscillospiraceae bacterium]